MREGGGAGGSPTPLPNTGPPPDPHRDYNKASTPALQDVAGVPMQVLRGMKAGHGLTMQRPPAFRGGSSATPTCFPPNSEGGE